MRLPRSLRARLTLAALLAVAIGGAIAGAVLLAAVARDGRSSIDAELRQQAAEVLRGPPGEGRFGPGERHGPEPLLAGSGTFVQLAVGNQVGYRALVVRLHSSVGLRASVDHGQRQRSLRCGTARRDGRSCEPGADREGPRRHHRRNRAVPNR